MTSLLQQISDIVAAAFTAEGIDTAYGHTQLSDRPDLADMQCNGALAAAKKLGRNPRTLAEKLVTQLQANSAFASVTIAGPGFLNFKISPAFLASYLASLASTQNLNVENVGKSECAVLDYGGPNIAKPMHVGHLRASIIGDSLRRLMIYAGFNALGDVHMGDWGTHLGMLFMDYARNGEEKLLLDVDTNNEEAVIKLFNDLSERYPKASAAAKADPKLMEEAQAATLKLQNGEEPFRTMWEIVKKVSILGMKKNFDALNVHFDLWKGEADVNDIIPPMVKDLQGKGYAVDDAGAVVIPVKRNDDNKEYPPLILYKRDGAVMYGTTDLATLVDRMSGNDHPVPSRVVYVVDQRQALHFEQLFRAAYLTSIAPANLELTHAGFGTMNGTDGKPFKTRAGGVMNLADLIGMSIEKAKERLAEAKIATDFSATEIEEIARKVGIAALKFADLQNTRTADYVFDIDRMTRFEGKTGPYLLYQAVRIKSLLRKAGDIKPPAALTLDEEGIILALQLIAWPETVKNALRTYTPHVICDYAYKLAQAFARFYGACPIISEENESLKQTRLVLCQLVLQHLEAALAILGIETPERM
ncbi:MAG: arginine--tRNA ligase [Alphaproteobacteria bacterium]|nr:arginine--tRNA ligase [Alphaproteobacteria bacterium]